ncbi:MAG: caspase family protein, partial [Bacteroidota bacterium]
MPNKSISAFSTSTESAAPTGKNYLFVVAIDNYLHCPKLFNAQRDADAIIELLTKNYQFDPENVVVLRNEEATEGGILNAFRDMVRILTPEDNLIIYFSGHGEFDPLLDEGYWIPVDVPQGAFEDYFPNSKIQKILNAVKARHIFLVADSCFSGTLFASYKSAAAADRLEKDPSRWGLTAGRNEVVADGKPGSHSPFADSLIYHLTNSQPPLGVAALCNKVIEDVIANANQTPRGEPLQVEGHRGGQFFFHPRHQVQGLFGASPKPAALPGLTVRQGNLLYSIPPQMQLGVPSRCEVRIAVDKEKLLENLENKENIEIRNIYVADEMEVELTTPFEEEDSPFKIKAITDRKQAIRDYTYTQWVFYVKPLRQGKFPLLLVVTVVENLDGKERVQDIVLEELVQVVADLPQDIEPGEGYKQARTFQLQPEVVGASGGAVSGEFKDVSIGGSKSIESEGGDFPETFPPSDFDVDFGDKKSS